MNHHFLSPLQFTLPPPFYRIQRRSVWTFFPKKSEIISNCAVATVLCLYVCCCQHLFVIAQAKYEYHLNAERERTVYEHKMTETEAQSKPKQKQLSGPFFAHTNNSICEQINLEVHKWYLVFVCLLVIPVPDGQMLVCDYIRRWIFKYIIYIFMSRSYEFCVYISVQKNGRWCGTWSHFNFITVIFGDNGLFLLTMQSAINGFY